MSIFLSAQKKCNWSGGSKVRQADSHGTDGHGASGGSGICQASNVFQVCM